MLRYENLHKRFGEKVIFEDLSFSVRESQIFFILGQSGTGKSVLLKSTVGLMRLDSGAIRIGGEDVTGFSEEQFFQVRRQCGLIFQRPTLFDFLNVSDNLKFGLRRLTNHSEAEIQDLADWALEKVHLQDFGKRDPNTLSFGEQKRVSLARALALRPKVLLFDEPTTGLDPQLSFSINNLIAEVARDLKTTTVVVSHDMDCAMDVADQIVVLARGQLVAQGAPEKLRSSSNELVRDFLRDHVGHA